MLARKVVRRTKIKQRVRKTVKGSASRPRLSVFRSNKDIYAQLIDDENGHTLLSASSKEVSSKKGPKVEQSKSVGTLVAERAKALKISEIVFDRGGYLYHGRVKALAEGAREGGLKF